MALASLSVGDGVEAGGDVGRDVVLAVDAGRFDEAAGGDLHALDVDAVGLGLQLVGFGGDRGRDRLDDRGGGVGVGGLGGLDLLLRRLGGLGRLRRLGLGLRLHGALGVQLVAQGVDLGAQSRQLAAAVGGLVLMDRLLVVSGGGGLGGRAGAERDDGAERGPARERGLGRHESYPLSPAMGVPPHWPALTDLRRCSCYS